MKRALIAVLLVGMAALSGCAPDEPVMISRQALGTVVSITAYGENEQAVRDAAEDAFAAMAEVEAQADVYDPASALSRFNADPYRPIVLPAAVSEMLDAVVELDVTAEFSPTLLAVNRLYAFEDGGRVPDSADLALALLASRQFGCAGDGMTGFTRLANPDPRLDEGGLLAPGIDLGGAAKGLALDRARETLRKSGAVTAAIITSGSSTVTLGTKPDGSVWRVGVEDPRDTDSVVAVFTFEADGALATSGDYQRYFEADGIRYHHIIDPSTGLPARGVRSLTVAGASLTGLHADILSTALFVRGPEGAAQYVNDRGLGLFVVDGEGRTHVVPAPAGSGASVTEEATPRRD